MDRRSFLAVSHSSFQHLPWGLLALAWKVPPLPRILLSFFFLFFTKLNKKGGEGCVYLYFHGVKSEPRLILEANQVRGKRKRRQPKKMKPCLEGQREAMGRDLREALNSGAEKGDPVWLWNRVGSAG